MPGMPMSRPPDSAFPAPPPVEKGKQAAPASRAVSSGSRNEKQICQSAGSGRSNPTRRPRGLGAEDRGSGMPVSRARDWANAAGPDGTWPAGSKSLVGGWRRPGGGWRGPPADSEAAGRPISPGQWADSEKSAVHGGARSLANLICSSQASRRLTSPCAFARIAPSCAVRNAPLIPVSCKATDAAFAAPGH